MNELSFKPAAISADIEQTSRPSQSYWQDAWRRLKANKRAITSLYVIIFLLLFAFLGPLVWRVDPAYQSLDQVSTPPWASRGAVIVPSEDVWNVSQSAPPTGSHTSPTWIEVAGSASTSRVRLIWEAVPNATGYRVYRNVIQPSDDSDYGLLVGTTEDPLDAFFEDQTGIRPKIYWYSVVAIDRDSNEFEGAATLEVKPQLTLTAAEAVTLGIVDDVQSVSPGDAVSLPWQHPLGTDYLGRDMLARLMKGAQVSLFIGIFAPVLFIVLGVVYGAVSGYFAGVIDSIMMRFADFVIALPFLLFMILFKVLFDRLSGDSVDTASSNILPMILALVVLSWPGAARLVRGEILKIREEGYVQASRLLGSGTGRLIMRHMIPNTVGVVLVTFTFAVPATIFTEAFLSFIGMGVVPPTPSWGTMCNDGIKSMALTPHELLFPALFISLTVLAFNLLGDGLRDALDARMRSRE